MNSSGLRLSVRSFLAFVAASGVCGGLLGCPVINVNHCANGGPTCAEGMACSMCEINNNGCVAEDAIVDPLCAFNGPATDPTTGVDSTSTTGPSDPSTTLDPSSTTLVPTATDETTVDVTSTTSTGPDMTTESDTTATVTTERPMCDPNEDMCAQPTPYCLVDTCVACTEIECTDFEPEKPTCNVELGVCVECVDNKDCPQDSKPFCDQETAKCLPCTMHEHCGGGEVNGPDTACNLETGLCFPEDNVLYVENSPGLPCSDAAAGTDPMMPICHLDAALAKVTPDKHMTIKLKQGNQPQNNSNVVPPDVTVAIVPRDLQIPSLLRNGVEPALVVSPGSLVFVHRLSMTNNVLNQTTNMIECTNASLWLERLNVLHAKTGVKGTNCLLHLRRTVVFTNSTGGVDVTEAASKLWLENSYVTDNGEIFGVRVVNGASAEVLYSSFAGNSDTVAAINCTNKGAGTVTLRNSLIAQKNGQFVTGCTVTTDEGNHKPNLASPQALIDAGVCSSYMEGVLRAEPDGPLKDLATWKQGDPVIDYDGSKVRPDMPGPDYAGADVP